MDVVRQQHPMNALLLPLLSLLLAEHPPTSAVATAAGFGSVGMIRSSWGLGHRILGLGLRQASPVLRRLRLP